MDKVNILVCDDDKEIVDAIEIYLQQEGYHVIKAYDGEQAIEQLEKNDVQLLIMDVMMPRLDGIRATLKIRENSSIPIIILSAKIPYWLRCASSDIMIISWSGYIGSAFGLLNF